MNLIYTRHATERMIERNITTSQIEQTIQSGRITGTRMNPGHKGEVTTYEMYFSGTRIRVAMTARGLIITVTH
jgi:hypothetical protein